ncbi:LOW QUALITY PROTEIN: hypothetical protein YC2023_122440 [Brassica napus]
MEELKLNKKDGIFWNIHAFWFIVVMQMAAGLFQTVCCRELVREEEEEEEVIVGIRNGRSYLIASYSCSSSIWLGMAWANESLLREQNQEVATLRGGGGSKTNFNGDSQIIKKSGIQIEKRDVDLLRRHGYLQAGQMNPLHSFVMHQQEITRGPSPQVAPSVLLQQNVLRIHLLLEESYRLMTICSLSPQASSEMPKQNHVSAYGRSPAQSDLDVQSSNGAQ